MTKEGRSMTKKEIVSLSLKLAGIYCILMALTYSSIAMISIFSYRGQSFLVTLFSLMPFILFLASGIYLIFSTKIDAKLIPSIDQESKPSSLSSHEIQSLAFSIIGVFVLVNAIPDFIQIIITVTSGINVSYLSHIVAVLIKLALGIYLFLGSKGLSGLWHKLQSTRSMKPSD
jgi:hypothetical protein